MGLFDGFKAWARKNAPGAFMDPKCAAVREGPMHVSGVDYLTSFRGLSPTDGFTLQQLANHLTSHIQDAVCWLVCDSRLNVPKLKRGEQASRAAATARADAAKGLAPAVAYPAGAHFDEAGLVCYPDDEDEVTEPIVLRRLAKTRHVTRTADPLQYSNLGNELWDALVPYVTAWIKRGGSPACKQFIFDFDPRGAYDFRRDTLGDAGPVRINEPHNLGEAEPALFFWAKKFDGRVDGIHLRTTDGDVVAIYASYHQERTLEQKARTRFWWHCDHDTVVDLGMLIEHLMVKRFEVVVPETGEKQWLVFPSPRSLMLFLIFGGTDFCQQRDIAFGCGVERCMLPAFLRIDWAMMNVVSAAARLANRPPDMAIFVEAFMVLLHNAKLPKPKTKKNGPPPPPATMESLRARYAERAAAALVTKENEHTKQHKKLTDEGATAQQLAAHSEAFEKKKRAYAPWVFPSKEKVAWAARLLLWNYGYWAGASTGIRPIEPVRDDMMVADEDEPEEEKSDNAADGD